VADDMAKQKEKIMTTAKRFVLLTALFTQMLAALAWSQTSDTAGLIVDTESPANIIVDKGRSVDCHSTEMQNLLKKKATMANIGTALYCGGLVAKYAIPTIMFSTRNTAGNTANQILGECITLGCAATIGGPLLCAANASSLEKEFGIPCGCQPRPAVRSLVVAGAVCEGSAAILWLTAIFEGLAAASNGDNQSSWQTIAYAALGADVASAIIFGTVLHRSRGYILETRQNCHAAIIKVQPLIGLNGTAGAAMIVAF
jgi:hypothetical protein